MRVIKVLIRFFQSDNEDIINEVRNNLMEIKSLKRCFARLKITSVQRPFYFKFNSYALVFEEQGNSPR